MLCIISSETQTYYAYSFAFKFPNYSCIQNLETFKKLKITFCFDRFLKKNYENSIILNHSLVNIVYWYYC